VSCAQIWVTHGSHDEVSFVPALQIGCEHVPPEELVLVELELELDEHTAM
jgi:hypothetical protein